jgi:hypothetical protein
LVSRFAVTADAMRPLGDGRPEYCEMAKTWDQLTPEEKIEDLRRDVVNLFDALNASNRARALVATHVDEAKSLAREAIAAVKELNKRLDSGQVERNVEAHLLDGLRRATDLVPPTL